MSKICLVFAAQTRHPLRNQVLVLLSVKAGLRAAEIANLTWPMVIDPSGEIGNSSNSMTELQRRAAAELFQSTLICIRLWSSSLACNSRSMVRSSGQNAVGR